ncbi:MAG TPA: VCBS repeat-containing protein [Pedobacter sp.]|nr:VCBS repeat-containing protein [Pedobacter sp.]
MYTKLIPCLWLSGVVLLSACNSKDKNSTSESALFSLVPIEQSHIDFNNVIEENSRANIMSYQYFYNGGGVATGDLNNDGLDDVYFSGNMTPAKLYLNKGSMNFEDITARAGINETGDTWKTGVTMADVNGDGKLDIYQCYSGGLPAKNRENKLYINQGNDASGAPLFQEMSVEYGLDDDSYSTQAVFFDYDKDGDLDMFLLNHNPKVFTTLDEQAAVVLKESAPMIRIKLYQNNDGKFEDKSSAAGLFNSSFTYGLGAGVADVNNDGWPDFYVSNDYSAPDYFYINNGNGTFTDQLSAQIGHTSLYSMGNDIADVNNDGLQDILTLDMLPEDNHRQKQLFAPDNYEYYNLRLKLGFHYQDMRNMLQINNGNGTFSEIGQLSGISNTDWSWAPLFADYDNDGWKDLFVSNGYLRDYTDMDFLKFKGDFLQQTDQQQVKANILTLINNMPASNVTNYVFKNKDGIEFTNKTTEWGMLAPSNSNGAAYSDLDNDGDLDLVINNINLPAFIYQNNASGTSKNQFLKIKLQGSQGNTQGVGAKIWLYSGSKQQYLEQNPSRGYQSSVSPILHFGIGNESIDSLRIVWPTGKQQTILKVKANQVLTLEEKNAGLQYVAPGKSEALFASVKSPIAFTAQKNNVNDFKRQPLITSPLSFHNPVMVKGDVNNDGLEDIFIGTAQGQLSELYIQDKNGTFVKKTSPAFNKDIQSEDADAVFFDANGDGHTDLYVASGGYNNYMPADPLLQDRLYLNDSKGNLTKSAGALPEMYSSKSCVTAADFNGDGYPDLFVGSRVIPGRYPEAPQSYLLINDGKGNFKDQISVIAPQLQKAGMITDAQAVDLNGDKKQDLVVIGEWMPVTAMINQGGKLVDKTTDYFGKAYAGWWNKLLVEDLNGDGHPDLVIGNTGLNTQCKASDKEPAELYHKDFDDNGSVDPILCFYIKGKSFPYVSRDEMLDQMSMMRTRYADYKSYADGTMMDIFTADELKGATVLKANHLTTALFINDGKGKFTEAHLPLQAQYAPVYTITALDYDKDGHKDLLLCGNISRARLKFGNSDANYGVLLRGNGNGSYTYIPQFQSGFNLTGDVRSVVQVKNTLLFGVNQQSVKAYQLR